MKLDMEKIEKGLGAKRVGSVKAGSGYFGAIQLAAEVQATRASLAAPRTPSNHLGSTWSREITSRRE